MSETIMVTCHGICTHSMLDDHHRLTILPNASDQARIDSWPLLLEKEVKVHVASLTIPTGSILSEVPDRWWFAKEDNTKEPDRTEWRLKGVQIELEEYESGGVSSSSPCIPSLQAVMHDSIVPPLLAGAAATDPVNVACLLKLPPSALIGENSKEKPAVVTSTTISTPASPTLVITRFNSTMDVVRIQLSDMTEIALSNIPQNPPGTPADYLLHFFSTDGFPGTASLPESMVMCAPPKPSPAPRTRPMLLMDLMPGDMTGPGCSNTNYP